MIRRFVSFVVREVIVGFSKDVFNIVLFIERGRDGVVRFFFFVGGM